MKHAQMVLLMLSILFLVTSVFAGEKIESPAYFKSRGYHLVKQAVIFNLPQNYLKNQLEWPIRFQSSRYSIGNSMAHFQKYGDGAPYFHGGCDLRVQAGEWVIAPVSGRIEAGDYGYSTRPDGSLEKFWKPWPTEGTTLYFEVAIVDDFGNRFEFHHVTKDSIPAGIVDLINQNGRVEAGMALAQTAEWPSDKPRGIPYHHIHYNIISPSGVRLNPEYFSKPIDDEVAPEILKIFFLDKSGSPTEVSNHFRINSPQEFVVRVQDRLGEDYYVHPPAKVTLTVENATSLIWDFTENLLSDLKFPNLFSFYKDALSKSLVTRGDYNRDVFLIRIPVPENQSGLTRLTFSDLAGNESHVDGEILP